MHWVLSTWTGLFDHELFLKCDWKICHSSHKWTKHGQLSKKFLAKRDLRSYCCSGWLNWKSFKYIIWLNIVSARRDSGNYFRIPEIALDSCRFSFILFSYPHVVPSCFSKQLLFLGADFCFWSWLVLDVYSTPY